MIGLLIGVAIVVGIVMAVYDGRRIKFYDNYKNIKDEIHKRR